MILIHNNVQKLEDESAFNNELLRLSDHKLNSGISALRILFLPSYGHKQSDPICSISLHHLIENILPTENLHKITF